MKQKHSAPIIVIGKNYSTSLGVIRGAGLSGFSNIVIKPMAAKQKFKTPELLSRYTEAYYYAIGDQEQEILRILKELSDPAAKRLVIPTDDFCASLLDRHYSELIDSFYLPSAGKSQGKLTELMDKGRQKEYAETCGLRCAKAITVAIDENGQYGLPEDVQFPCYTKPLRSIGSPKSYIKRCDDTQQLEDLLIQVAKEGPNQILVEEYLNIENEYVVPGAALEDGRVVIPAMIRKTKIGSGEHKGVTAMGCPVEGPAYDQVIGQLSAFISRIGLVGLFDIEVIESDGKFYFNELNLRYGAAGYGITANGVNLPGIYASSVLGSRTEEIPTTLATRQAFVSEKVEIEAFGAGYMSWKEYVDDNRSVPIHFIRQGYDKKPYISYLLIVGKTVLKRLLKGKR